LKIVAYFVVALFIIFSTFSVVGISGIGGLYLYLGLSNGIWFTWQKMS